MGMLIDNFGWLGNPAIELSWSRVVAMVLLGLALVFMYRSSSRSVGSSANASRPNSYTG
ncbi:hypothetical protein D3C84_1166490 [compost metagenome]